MWRSTPSGVGTVVNMRITSRADVGRLPELRARRGDATVGDLPVGEDPEGILEEHLALVDAVGLGQLLEVEHADGLAVRGACGVGVMRTVADGTPKPFGRMRRLGVGR